MVYNSQPNAKRNIRALILCAGVGGKWHEHLGIPKQLLKIEGETLLQRMVRLLQENGVFDIHIISYDERLKMESCGFFKPERRRLITETLLSSRELWHDRTVVLLGDVFFTDSAMRTILSCDAGIKVFGRPRGSSLTMKVLPEIFALTFDRERFCEVIKSISAVISRAGEQGSGRLWHFYDQFCGLPYEGLHIETRVLQSMDDFTDDFDNPVDYERFCWIWKLHRARWFANPALRRCWRLLGSCYLGLYWSFRHASDSLKVFLSRNFRNKKLKEYLKKLLCILIMF